MAKRQNINAKVNLILLMSVLAFGTEHEAELITFGIGVSLSHMRIM